MGLKLDIDFNNVQDQNLVDDSVIDDISAETPPKVGSVVHPGDTTPATPAAPAPPPMPASDGDNDSTPHIPTAQEILGDKLDDESVPNLEAPVAPSPPDDDEENTTETEEEAPAEPSDADIPEPTIESKSEPAEADEQQPEEEEHLIAAPADDAVVEPEAEADQETQPEAESDSEPEADVDADVAAANKADSVTDEQGDDENFVAPALGQGNGDDEELLGVKQEALEELSPLVDHLDLPPEQKFDTLMEILRASDDKTLVKPALEVAKEIEDDEKRAQALLDVVNEVNYLTQDEAAQPEA